MDRNSNDTISGLVSSNYLTQMQEIFDMVISIIAYIIIGMGPIGIAGNIVNLVVFLSLGFSETIHMSYVALAICDIGCILTTVWTSLTASTKVVEGILARFRVKTDFVILANFTRSWPHLALSRTTAALLTAWISFERCLCVFPPTRVKLIITPRVTKTVISVLYAIGCCPVVFAYVGFTTEMKFDPVTNVTTLLLFTNKGNQLKTLNQFAFLLYAVVYPVISWVVVAISAVFLILKLKQSARWRDANSRVIIAGSPLDRQKKRMFCKEARVIKTVVLIACTFIFCSFPISATVLMRSIAREYSLGGQYRFIIIISTGISYIFTEFNSSINIAIYTFTGTKFRSALFDLFQKRH
ncbi:peptide receptor GPCR [Elysia marginata]|uniref:Peptide receptor GPCR n=1 Tax=Elysia marginata TaxID=1093978 RepID=A0AAV4HJ01_9GAST|nr:peptide receptor GPCR [Elysia marginata]